MATPWIKGPDELAELMVCMSFGGMNEVAGELSEMLHDREKGNPDYDASDQVNVADLLWSWASSRMENLQAERAKKHAAETSKQVRAVQ